MKSENILLSTPLLKWYLEHDLIVSRIYQVTEFRKLKCFASFCNEVTQARREGDSNSGLDVIANTMKLIGNSGYGSLIMAVEKFQNIKYVKGQREVFSKIKSPLFRNATEILKFSSYRYQKRKLIYSFYSLLN